EPLHLPLSPSGRPAARPPRGLVDDELCWAARKLSQFSGRGQSFQGLQYVLRLGIYQPGLRLSREQWFRIFQSPPQLVPPPSKRAPDPLISDEKGRSRGNVHVGSSKMSSDRLLSGLPNVDHSFEWPCR